MANEVNKKRTQMNTAKKKLGQPRNSIRDVAECYACVKPKLRRDGTVIMRGIPKPHQLTIAFVKHTVRDG